MTALVVYLAVALGASFLCSLLEASLLSLPRSYIALLVDQERPAGARLAKLKANIDQPLAAILTLNTFAHTIGAAGVGAQAAVIWGEAWVGVVGFVVTLLILVFSEVIPKTLGAVHARRLAGFTAVSCTILMRLLYPAVVACNWLSRALSGRGSRGPAISRDELRVVASWAHDVGEIDQIEARIIRNMIALRDVTVNEVMTPRTVVVALGVDQTIGEIAKAGPPRFSRLPVIGSSLDDVHGMIHRQDLIEALSAGDLSRTLRELARPVHLIPAVARLPDVLRMFIERREHLFVVVDEYGGSAGVITLEDVIETILGLEIVDETDDTDDMQALAKRLVAGRRRSNPLTGGVNPFPAEADPATRYGAASNRPSRLPAGMVLGAHQNGARPSLGRLDARVYSLRSEGLVAQLARAHP